MSNRGSKVMPRILKLGPTACRERMCALSMRYVPGLYVKADKEDTAAYAIALDLLLEQVRA
eukprot:12497986-Alexandrium_andersonii.AAC.1